MDKENETHSGSSECTDSVTSSTSTWSHFGEYWDEFESTKAQKFELIYYLDEP